MVINTTSLKIENFSWLVSKNGYYWDDNCQPFEKTLKSYLKNDHDKLCHPFLVECETKGITLKSYGKLFRPFQDKNSLMVDFANFKETKEDIVKFADKYGQLTGEEQFITFSSDKGLMGFVQGNKRGSIGFGDSLLTWIREMRIFKEYFKIWKMIENEDVGKLGQQIIWRGTGKDSDVCFYYFDRQAFRVIASSHDMIFKKWCYGEVISPAKYLLREVINEKLEKNISMKLFLDKKGAFYQGVTPKNLLSAIWYQFLQTVTGNRKIIRCKVCNELLDVTGEHGKLSQHPKCKRDKARIEFNKRAEIYKIVASKNNLNDDLKAKEWVLNQLEIGNPINVEGYTHEEFHKLFENVLKDYHRTKSNKQKEV